MSQATSGMRQVVDWGAAIWAGIVAGIIFLIFNLFVTPSVTGGNAWVVIRLLASIFLGESILAPPATFNLTALTVALTTHFVLSISFTLTLAFLIHRWGLVVGIIGGALFGLALYSINFYTLTYFFPWFYAMRSWAVIVSHVVFGAVAGGVYESLEVEEFIPYADLDEEA